jgi:hypothetical protein
MAALAAARANPALRAFWRRLRAAGKPHRVVLTAVPRKLIVLANALVRDDVSGPTNRLDRNTDGYLLRGKGLA